MFQKVAVPVISRCPFLTGVAGLQYTVCKANKDEQATKFVFKTTEITSTMEFISSEIDANGFSTE